MIFRGIIHINELKYPPPNVVKQKGRLNDIDESILYASACKLGTIIELKPELHKIFTISKIECIKPDSILFAPLGMLQVDYKFTKQEKEVASFLNNEMTKVVDNPSEYNFTIALAKQFIGSNINNSTFDSHLAISYPSVESEKISNKTTFNIAMKPDTFDTYFQIVDVEVCCILNKNTHYDVLILNKTKSIQNKKLLWHYDIYTMKQRIKNGFDANGKFHKEIQLLNI